MSKFGDVRPSVTSVDSTVRGNACFQLRIMPMSQALRAGAQACLEMRSTPAPSSKREPAEGLQFPWSGRRASLRRRTQYKPDETLAKLEHLTHDGYAITNLGSWLPQRTACGGGLCCSRAVDWQKGRIMPRTAQLVLKPSRNTAMLTIPSFTCKTTSRQWGSVLQSVPWLPWPVSHSSQAGKPLNASRVARRKVVRRTVE